MYQVVLAPEAVEDLRALKAFVRAAVREGLDKYLRHAPTKTSKSRIKRLRGLTHPQYRLRVETVRVFYDVNERVVEILAIVPKDGAKAWLERAGVSDERSGPQRSER